MSTAQKFGFKQPFPLCLEVVDSGSDYVGGLTLAQIMALFWNLETFTLSTDATAHMVSSLGPIWDVSAVGDIVFSPISTTGDWTPIDTFLNIGVFKDFYAGTVGYSQTSKAPINRVCNSTIGWFTFGTGGSSSGNTPFVDLILTQKIDPLDATKYAVEYDMFVANASTFHDGDSVTVGFTPSGGFGNVINTGVFTISGIDFPYVCSCDRSTGGSLTVTTTGGTLSATSSDYTY